MTKQPAPLSRNKQVGKVKVSDIIAHPDNFRTHGQGQRDALQGTVDTIGWYGYLDVFEHPDYPGKFMLVDGELRAEHVYEHYGKDAVIEVNVTDFTPDEAGIALASKDPISAMAGTNAKKLSNLLESLGETDENMKELLSDLALSARQTLQDQQSKAAEGNLLGSPTKSINTRLTGEQHTTIFEAIKIAKTRYRVTTIADALAHICRDFAGDANHGEKEI